MLAAYSRVRISLKSSELFPEYRRRYAALQGRALQGGTHIDRTCGLSLLEQEKEQGEDILWVVSIPSMCDLLCLNHLHTAHLKSTLTPVSRTHTSITPQSHLNHNYNNYNFFSGQRGLGQRQGPVRLYPHVKEHLAIGKFEAISLYCWHLISH